MMLGTNASDKEVMLYGTTEEKLERFEALVNDAPDHSEEINQYTLNQTQDLLLHLGRMFPH